LLLTVIPSLMSKRPRRESPTKAISQTTGDEPYSRPTGSDPAACLVNVSAVEQEAQATAQLHEWEDAGLQTIRVNDGVVSRSSFKLTRPTHSSFVGSFHSELYRMYIPGG
jgi:hypothetical protein